MLEQMIGYLISKLGPLVEWFSGIDLGTGFSLGAFLIAIFLVVVMIRAFLLVRR